MESHFLRKFSGIEKKLTHGATLLLASLEEAKLGCFATSLAPLEINRVDKTVVSTKPQNETKMTLLISTKDDLNSVS